VLYIVLILVLAALAGVVTALITANSLWAWISIGLSVLAGIVLFVDWMRRRSASDTAEPAEEPSATADDDEDDSADREGVDTAEDPAAKSPDPDGETPTPASEHETAAPTAMLAAAEKFDGAHERDADDEAGSADLRTRDEAAPGEEETDAADLLIVSELDVEVVVVDEYPRYHLTDCSWLADRDTIPIQVAEARELGFTPCARCSPDEQLAAAHRRKRKSRADR
jgi:hypothetical protein